MVAISFYSCDPYEEHFDIPINTVSKYGITVSAYVGEKNSVGGFNVQYVITNNSGKEIKYMYIDCAILNYYGDRVYCEVWDRSTASVKITGPIRSGDTYRCYRTDLFYNYQANKCHITHCCVDFVDGTELEILK